MPTTSFAGKRPAYIERYARTIAAAQRFADIQRTIDSEQDRINYLDSLIAAESQNLTALQQTFSAPPADTTQLAALIKESYTLEDTARQRAARQAAAGAAAVRVPAQLEASIRQAATQPGGAAMVRAIASEGVVGATPERAAKVVQLVQGLGVLSTADLQELVRLSGTARARAPGVRETEAERERRQQLGQSLEAFFFASPAGIRGGYAGQDIVNQRALTASALKQRAAGEEDAARKAQLEERAAALEGSSFATAEDALQAALAVVRATGDPAQIEDEYARTIYEEARQSQAYRNDQRADFEQSVLESRKKLAQLEQRRAAAPGAQYVDPQQELLRRELTARGYDFERNGGRFVRYQNTPYYDPLVRADDMLTSVLDEGMKLEPVNRAQRMAETLVLQFDRTGDPYNIDTLRKQLGKALKGEELTDALAYALAFKEYEQRNLADPTQAEAQKKLRAAEKQRQDSQKRQAEALKQQEAEARAQADAAAAQVRQMRAERPDYSALYARARAAGLSPETARGVARSQMTADREIEELTFQPAAETVREEPPAPAAPEPAPAPAPVRRAAAPAPAPAAPEPAPLPASVMAGQGLPGSRAAAPAPAPAAPAPAPAAPAPGAVMVYDPITNTFKARQ